MTLNYNTRPGAEYLADKINKIWLEKGENYNARAEPVHNGIWGVRSDYVVRVG